MQDNIIQALGWTFVHSLWQGMLLAVLAGLIILLTRKSGAKLRYTLLLSLFCLFLAATVFTFINQLNKGTVITNAQPLAAVQDKASGEYDLFSPVMDSEVKEVNNRFTDRFVQYFNTHAPMIVLIWFIVFSARMVKLLANLGYVQRIRYQKTHNPTAHWKRRMQQMADGLLIRQKLQLLESEIVNVPVVVGFFKPVILIPLGLVTHLPPAQVEAILLHELAHIKRRDYFVNLLQSFAETIFFFNPAVLWLSSLIREERENCCDDIAVAGSGNKTAFLDALVSFQEYTHKPSGYGMAFPGRKNHLLNRVKRILHQKNKTLNTMEKSLLTISIAFILLLMLGTARQVQGQNDTPATAAKAPPPPPPPPPVLLRDTAPAVALAPPPPVRQSVHANRAPVAPKASPEPPAAPVPPLPSVVVEPAVVPETAIVAPVPALLAPPPPVLLRDTAPAENRFPHLSCTISDDGTTKTETLQATDRAGTTYKMNKLNDVITYFSVNGIEVPKEQYDKYQPLIDEMEQQRSENKKRAEKMHRKSVEVRTQALKLQQQQRDLLVMNRQQAERMNDQNVMLMNKSKMLVDKQEREVQLQKVQAMRLQKDVFGEQKIALFNKKEYEVRQKLFLMKDEEYKARKGFVSKNLCVVPCADIKLSVSPVYKTDIQVNPKLKISYRDESADIKQQKELARALISDLVKDGIISAGNLEWFGITDREFIVNGIKQPADILEKYKAKYLIHPGMGMFYGPVKMTGTGFFFGKGEL